MLAPHNANLKPLCYYGLSLFKGSSLPAWYPFPSFSYFEARSTSFPPSRFLKRSPTHSIRPSCESSFSHRLFDFLKTLRLELTRWDRPKHKAVLHHQAAKHSLLILLAIPPIFTSHPCNSSFLPMNHTTPPASPRRPRPALERRNSNPLGTYRQSSTTL